VASGVKDAVRASEAEAARQAQGGRARASRAKRGAPDNPAASATSDAQTQWLPRAAAT